MSWLKIPGNASEWRRAYVEGMPQLGLQPKSRQIRRILCSK